MHPYRWAGLLLIVSCVAAYSTCAQVLSSQELANILSDNRSSRHQKHIHRPSLDASAAAEADRFIAMMFVVQCDIESAERYFSYAREHDPKNSDVGRSQEEMKQYLAIRSKEIERIAIESELYLAEIESSFGKKQSTGMNHLLQMNQTKLLYQYALMCDKNNLTARAGYERMWVKQHGNWSFLDRLGYHLE